MVELLRSKLRWVAMAVALAAATPFPVFSQGDAVNVSGVSFRRALEAAGTPLSLHRAVLFRYKRIFRAYVAALYLGPGVGPDRVLADVPKRLELSYCVGIDGEDFGPAAEEILGRMYTPEQLAPLRERLDRLHRTYRDVEDGDRYALTYVPGRGTELALNGRPLVTIPGADFQRAYFSIWFGRRPLSSQLRDDLLAGPQP